MAITYDEAKGGYTDGATTWKPNNDGVYEIDSLDQLKFFRDAVNDGNSFNGQTVKLTVSINLNNEEWAPIGKSGKPFQGTFDGNGNTVSNLYINTPTQNDVGFFGYTSVGEIKNLTIKNANVTGYLDVGAVAGTPYTSKYTNITLTGDVKIQGFSYVGGMFGKNVYADLTKLTIDAAEDSYVTADSVETDPVEGDVAYRTYVGGVIGFMGEGNTVVKNVTSNINVSGSTCDVGGITGIAHYGNSFVNVTCTADEVVLTDAEAGLEHEVGGIAGVWYNQANTTVQFINCNVENTTAVKSILNGVEQDVSSNITSGKSYNAETATSGSQLIGQNVVIEADGKYSAGEFTVSGPNAVNVLNGKLSDGLTVYPTADGVLSVDEAGYVASVNNIRYKSLADAIAAAGAGGTVTLIDDVTLSSKLVLNQAQVFDLNGFTLDGAVSLSGEADVTFQNGKMTAAYSSTTSNSYSVVQVNGSSVLTLDGVTLTPADSSNRSQATHAIVYQSTGALNIKNSTVAGGNLVHDKNYTSGTNQAACAIYAYGNSAGTIQIEESTITGGAGKTDAEYDGTYKSGLYVEGGEAIKLGGSAAITINSSTVTGGASDWYNAADAVNVTNTFSGTLNIENASKISGGDALNLSGETSRGIGGAGIYTNQSTSCTEIVVTDSEIEGGNGGHSWNGSALELNTSAPEVTITNSTLTVGQGENSSGNAGAIRVNNTNTIDLNLNGVTLDGAGNANQVFQITSNVSNGGISLAGENTISGGTLENVTFIEVAEGTTITTTGDGKVDPVTVLNPVSTPVYDETTGAYVFEPVETSTATLLVNSNWASLPDGTAVQYDGANYRLGTNAFSDISDAAATEASNKILVIDGTYSGDQFFNGHEVEIGSADTAVSFENYVFGGAQNGNTGDISLKFVNGSAARVYGTALNQAGDYTTGNITLEISEDVALTERIGAAKIEQGNLTTGDVVINFAGSALPIFGGAQVWYKGSSATHDSVTINTSGTLSDVVYAAGQAMHGGQITINNGVTTNVTGGSIGTDGLMGGGFTRSDANQTDTAGSITIHGGTWINISGGEITNVYGGTHTYSEGGQLKSVSTITGGTHISMTGGTVGNVQGGGYTAWGSEATIDSTYVSISGGTVTGDVQGGSYVVGGGKNKDSGNSSTITGDATVVISGNANIQGSVYGGSWVNWATGTAASYIGGTSTVIVEGGTIAGNVAGGGVTYAYSGDGENSKLVSEHEATEVRLTGGTIQGSVIGGGVALDNYGKATLSNTVSETSVVIDGATVEGDIIAGGYAEGQNAETEVMGDVSLSIVSGTIKGDVYGGSIGGSIGGNSTISISGGDIQGGVYAADVTTEGFLGSSILNFDNEGALDTAITEINGFDEVNFNGGTVNFTSGTVSFANTVINMTVNGESSTLTAETIDNSATIYVTGTGAYAPNVNLIDEGKIVFGKKDATFDGTYAGTIDGQASDLATVQVLNGSLTLESGATIDLIGNFDKNRGFILGTVDAAEDDGTMTAVVTVKEGATLNARNYFWIGSANGSYETPEEQSKRFKLIIDGGKVDATSNAFTLRNTGAMEILNGGSFSAHDGSVRNYISVTGEGSYLEYGGNVYGEAPSGAEGAPTYGTASITVSDGATANFTKLSIGGEGASRENRRGSVTLSNATATAKTILLSQANENEEIRAELSLENSSLTADAITNYGAVNVTGASTLDAEFMAAGTGLLNLNSVAFGSGTSVNDTASYTNNTIGSEIVMTGTNTLTDGAFVSTGWSKNFRLGYETGTESDSLEISGGATLKVGGVSYIGSDPEDKKAGAYQVTVSGAGSSFAGSGAGEELYLRGDGRLTVKDDASASFSYADIKGSVILENGNFSFIDSRLIGTIAMDYASTLTFSGEINPAGGAITVDMTGFSGGVYKLIDYTGSNSYTKEQYKALIGEANWNENFTIVNNDLYAVNVDTSTLKVNAAWSGTAIGTEVAEGFYYGFNAFDTFQDAYMSDTDAVTIKIGSDLDNVTGELGLDAPYRSDIQISSEDGNNYTLAFGSPSSDGLYAWNAGQTITIDKEISLVNMAQLMAVATDTVVTIDGNVTSMQLWAGFGGTVNINETATVTLTYGDGWLTLRDGGTVNVKGTVENASTFDITSAQAQFDLGYSSIGDARSSNNYAGSTNVFNMTNTFVDGGAWLNLGAATWDSGRNSVNMTNSVFKVNALNMYNDGQFNVGNGSRVIVNGALKAAEESVLNITDDSSVSVKTLSVETAAQVNMDYTSTLAFGSITNDGTITIDTEGFSSGIYKILDYTGTGTYTKDQYKALLGNNWNDYYTVVNNDLYLTNLDGSEVRYVNSAWSSSNPYDEVMFVDGTRAYYGQNAFDTVDHALTATSYENGIWLNVTGDIGAITVVGASVTEVNASAKDQIDPETGTVAADAIVVNLVDINNTNAGWQVYYPLASGSNAQIYGDITTNFLSSTFTEGSQTADPNFAGAGYAGTTATVYGDTMVNIGADGAANDALFLNTGFLLGAGGGTVNGDSSLNIYSGTIEAGAVVGGGAWRGQVKGDSSVTISGGEITLVGTSTYSAVYGGSYGNVSYDPDAPGDPAATAGNTSVTIKGDAVVNGKVIGGSDQTAVTGTTVEISGEAQVNGNVYAGGNRGGQVTGNTSVTLTGGTVTGNVYGGGDNSSVIGDTSVIVNGADVGTGIFGGSLNGDVNNTVVEIRNFTRLQPVPGTQSDKIQIVGGGMAEAGKSSTTASTNVTVTDSKIYGDVVAGSSATGTGATAISGKSVVNVSNLEINGYSEGSNIWTGRVFGAGRAQYGGSVVTESTDVTIENMSGYTYDSEGNIIDGSNKGARVYGAGQAYASMSRVEVGETKLRISGDATNISEIYGGGIVSGTEVQEKAAFQIVGKTDVEITGGTVTDVIAGGNNTNWFGRTVIGVDAGDGTYQAAEGEYGIRLVIGGSTKVNEGALVTGGSYVDFAYEYQNIVDGVDTYGRTAEIYGNTYMELTEDSVISTDVFGGSFAYYEQVDFSADVSKLSAPSATQYGDVTVVVSGNTAIAGSVYGGGAVLTNTDQVKTTSVTNGDVSVLISGGAVGGNVYAGGYYADVNGNASVTLSGGTVGGDIYGGSEGSGTVAGSSTLNVGATDAARYTTTLNNVYDFDVANITNAAVTVEGVFSATQISIADSTLTLNSGFDAATTTVSIEVGAYNAENAALVLGSAVGTAPAISISAGSNALTEARYLVATGFDDTTAFSLDESLAGEYILRAVDGNIYLYNADAPYFTTELSVTQAEGASVDGYYSFTANFEAAGLLTGYTLKLYDSATATTPVDEVTLDADVIGQEFTLENTTQSFWISVTANGENGLSTDSPTSGRLEVVVKDYDSPVIQSVSSNVASDAITLTSEATDNFGVTGYEFILDGQSLGVQTGSEIALDLSTLTAGTHSYTVNVYDAAGNLATSAEQSFDFTPGPGPEPGPTEPANFLYSSQVRMDNGETVSVYATYSDAAAALEYRIGDSGEWLTYDATTGVNVSSSTTVYFREQGITDPVETAVDVTVVPADVELNAEVILLAPTTDTTYEVIYNFADGGSKAVELSGNSVEHYALPENTTVTIVEKDASGEVVNTIVEETPAASTTAEIPDKVVAVDDGHDNLFFAMPVGQWGTGIAAQHLGDGTWGGTLEIVSLTGKNRFSTVFTGSDDATTLFLTDDANGDVFFLDDIYTANGSDARIRKMSEIQAGAGDDIVDLTSARFAYEEHASKQLTVRGGDGNDILWGNAGHNIMFGDDGNDRIYGGSDNDVLIGGTGNDTMLGGGGDDIFCYGSSFDWGSDTITQLSGGTVTLYLDGIDRNDCSISGSTLTWNDGTHTGSITLNGVSWDSVKFYCAANGDGDLTKQSDYEELKNKGAFAAISSH